MTSSKQNEAIMKWVVLGIVTIIAAFQIYAERGLFADGSYQFLNFLIAENPGGHQGNFFAQIYREFITRNNEPTRLFVYLFAEFPTVLALRLGVTNIHVLTYIFSGWLSLSPLLFWGFGLAKLRGDVFFWPFTLLFCLIYFAGNFFIIGEYNLAYSITAFCFAMMLKKDADTCKNRVLLGCAAFLSIMSYASTMFSGVLLAVLAIQKSRKEPKAKYYWQGLACLFATSVGVGIWAYFHPALPENFKNASNPAILIYEIQFWVVFLLIGMAATMLFVKSQKGRDIFLLLIYGVATLIAFGICRPTPYMGYAMRAFTGLGLSGAVLLFASIRFYGERFSRHVDTKRLASPALAILLALSVLDIRGSLEFRQFLDDYKEMVDSRTGFVRFEETAAYIPNCDRYGWGWIYPSLSLVLRKNASAGFVLDPDYQRGRWSPFNPANMPDLGRYYVE